MAINFSNDNNINSNDDADDEQHDNNSGCLNLLIVTPFLENFACAWARDTRDIFKFIMSQ